MRDGDCAYLRGEARRGVLLLYMCVCLCVCLCRNMWLRGEEQEQKKVELMMQMCVWCGFGRWTAAKKKHATT